MEAIIGVQVFGSAKARELTEAWRLSADKDDYEAQIRLAGEIRQQVREELWYVESDVKPVRPQTAIVSKFHDETDKIRVRSGSLADSPKGTTRIRRAEERLGTTTDDDK
ncbi:hypothetical protein [Streptosporangium sp. G12]